MLRLIIYNFKTYFRNRVNWIWNFLFPFAYLLIFLMAMHSMGESHLKLPDVPITIVYEEGALEKSTLTELSFTDFLSYADSVKGEWIDDNLVNTNSEIEKPLLIYTEGTKDEARAWLKDGKTYATVYIGEKPRYEVIDPGKTVEAMVLNKVLEVYQQTNNKIEQVSLATQEGRLSILEALNAKQIMEEAQIKTLDKSTRSEGVSPTNVFYFAVLAYIAYYPINAGSQAVDLTEANKSKVALRNTTSPYSKARRFISAFLPILFAHILSTTILFLFASASNISLGDNPLHALGVLLLTTLAALLTGTMISSIFNFNENVLTGIYVGLPLFLAFCAGMMNDRVRSGLEESAPWLSKISPIGNASNALFYLNLGEPGLPYLKERLMYIGIFCAVMLALTLLGLRRSKYVSL